MYKRQYGISVEDLRKRVNTLALKGTPAEKRIQPKSGGSPMRKKESAADKSQKLMLTWLVTYPAIFDTVEKYLSPSDFVVPLYKEVAEMLWKQHEEGDVNPARLLNAFTDSEEQKEVASLFNATIHLETKEDVYKRQSWMWDRDYPFWCSQRDRICCMMVVQEARPAMWCPICRSRMCQKLII